MEFVRTGIPDFDNLFSNGGYPKGNQILVMGGPGSGKSIFGLQYLYAGIREYGEPGIFVTLEETPEKIRKDALQFNWDLKALEKEKKLIIIDAVSARVGAKVTEQYSMQTAFDINTMLAQIQNAIKEIKAKRLVIDSLSVMGLYSQSEIVARTNMLRMANVLSTQDVTTLIITEAKTEEMGKKEFPPETFMFDGVITLRLDIDNKERRIAIRKMRGTKHVLGSFRFEIGETGISIR